MSAQPPHRRVSWFLRLAEVRHSWLLVAASCLIFTGCATQNEYQLAEPDTVSLIGDRSQRDQYLSGVRSDPLGAYLSAQSQAARAQNAEGSLAHTALTYIGIKYRFGGDTPTQGFDCSGLVRYAAEKSLGLKLPRRSSEMARLGQSVKRNDLERGDLVFFNTRGQRFSHVGIYLGDGKFVHAPSSGSKVRVESMDLAYWQKRYNGARRLASSNSGARAAAKAKPSTKLASK